MTFDLDTFRTTLYGECKYAFLKIIDELSCKNIYALALYNSGEDWIYLFPTVSTQKGLDEAVEHYSTKEYLKIMPKDKLKAILKWDPCDSPHHDRYISMLPNIEKMLLEASGMDELMEEENHNLFHERVTHICMDVLSQLDRDGTFGALDRSSFVLNLLNGDQSDEERAERAGILNPKNVFLQYKHEMAFSTMLLST